MKTIQLWGPLVMLLALVAAGCERAVDANSAPVTAAADNTASVHTDSVFPIEEELRRFRATLPDSAAALAGGVAARDDLVDAFVAALEAGDSHALLSLVITPAEFAWLYYPHTKFTRRPYELSPGLVWFQLERYGSRGLQRALERHGSQPLGVIGHMCTSLEEQGPNRVWGGCTLQRVGAGGDTTSLSLFGGILERDGRFKFLSYGNRL